jgi:hypothetical protein
MGVGARRELRCRLFACPTAFIFERMALGDNPRPPFADFLRGLQKKERELRTVLPK